MRKGQHAQYDREGQPGIEVVEETIDFCLRHYPGHGEETDGTEDHLSRYHQAECQWRGAVVTESSERDRVGGAAAEACNEAGEHKTVEVGEIEAGEVAGKKE